MAHPHPRTFVDEVIQQSGAATGRHKLPAVAPLNFRFAGLLIDDVLRQFAHIARHLVTTFGGDEASKSIEFGQMTLPSSPCAAKNLIISARVMNHRVEACGSMHRAVSRVMGRVLGSGGSCCGNGERCLSRQAADRTETVNRRRSHPQ